MLKNYIKIAYRNAIRYKGYTALNLLGLVVGIASSLLILLWVQDERGVDQFHEKGDKIYQVFRNMRQSGGMVNTTWSIPKPVSDLMRAEYPEVMEIAMYSWEMEYFFKLGDNASRESGRHVTPEFLSVFSYPLLVGDPASALNDLNSLIISRSVAEKFFGENWKKDILGKTLRINDERDATITGVFEDLGSNTSHEFDYLIPAQEYFNKNSWVDDWGNGSFATYFTVANEADAEAVATRIFNEIKVHAAGQDNSGDETLVLQKFEEGYLHSEFENGVVTGGRIRYVQIMTVVAIFILLVACINFMNLATARSSRRSKEIGIRKVMGAQKQSIRWQFLLEATILAFISVFISVIIVSALLPYFNILVDKSLFIDFTNSSTWVLIIGLTLIIGLLSGSYPALLLPNFNIVSSLKGNVKQSAVTTYMRKGLVVFQFGISTLLIIGTVVIFDQMKYVLTKDLGLDKENLVVVRMEGDLSQRLETYKTELRNIPEVISVTAASGNPINYGRSTSSTNWPGKDPNSGHEVNVLMTDDDFIEGMGMEILKGRGFSDEFADSTNFVINEVFAEIMGFEDPVDQSLSFWGIDGKVIGVVKNFHMRDLYEPIAPLIITCFSPSNANVALVRVQGNMSDALADIEDVTMTLNPSYEFRYEFLDQSYAENYQSEEMLSRLATIFAAISIFISCLGLFGLSSYTAEQRSREIGVRKVHGASVWQILFLLSREYSKLMIIAFIIAIPFGYYYAQQWLDNFEFRTNIDPLVFVLAGIVTFIVGVLTVSTKSYQAASVNPVNTLKDE